MPVRVKTVSGARETDGGAEGRRGGVNKVVC